MDMLRGLLQILSLFSGILGLLGETRTSDGRLNKLGLSVATVLAISTFLSLMLLTMERNKSAREEAESRRRRDSLVSVAHDLVMRLQRLDSSASIAGKAIAENLGVSRSIARDAARASYPVEEMNVEVVVMLPLAWVDSLAGRAFRHLDVFSDLRSEVLREVGSRSLRDLSWKNGRRIPLSTEFGLKEIWGRVVGCMFSAEGSSLYVCWQRGDVATGLIDSSIVAFDDHDATLPKTLDDHRSALRSVRPVIVCGRNLRPRDLPYGSISGLLQESIAPRWSPTVFEPVIAVEVNDSVWPAGTQRDVSADAGAFMSAQFSLRDRAVRARYRFRARITNELARRTLYTDFVGLRCHLFAEFRQGAERVSGANLLGGGVHSWEAKANIGPRLRLLFPYRPLWSPTERLNMTVGWMNLLNVPEAVR